MQVNAIFHSLRLGSKIDFWRANRGSGPNVRPTDRPAGRPAAISGRGAERSAAAVEHGAQNVLCRPRLRSAAAEEITSEPATPGEFAVNITTANSR